jgi:hypothetical protein
MYYSLSENCFATGTLSATAVKNNFGNIFAVNLHTFGMILHSAYIGQLLGRLGPWKACLGSACGIAVKDVSLVGGCGRLPSSIWCDLKFE